MNAPDWTTHTDGKKRLALIQFDDVESAVAYANRPVPKGREFEQRDNPNNWNGNVTLNGACKLATAGWREGRERLATGLEAYQAAQSLGNDRSLGYDVAGYRPDVGRAIAGDTLSMINNAPELSRRVPIVSLAMSVHVSGGVSAEQLTIWGIALASHVDALEAAGYRVALSVLPFLGSNYDRGAWVAALVNIKAPEQPLDLDRLAYWMAHPSTLRRIGLALCDQRPASFENVAGSPGYGYPAEIRKPIAYDAPVSHPLPAKLAREVLPETTAYLPSAQQAFGKARYPNVAAAVDGMRPCIEAALKLEDVDAL